jgi:hypothetical protein
MAQYLLNIMQPDDGTPEPEALAAIMAELAALSDEMRDAGAFVFTAGLHPASTATVVQARGADVLTTDGPFAEGKEHVGGFHRLRHIPATSRDPCRKDRGATGRQRGFRAR